MRVVRKSLIARVALALALAGVLGAAHADITTQERVAVSGPGGLAMMNMSGTTTTTIAGKRARTDSDLQFESGMMRALARGVGQSGEIVQLDADKIIELNPKKKTYTESTFTQRREAMQKNLEQMQNAQAKQQQSVSGVNEESCEWSEPKASVKRSGEKATIGGYAAERVVTTATQSCKDKKTGQVCDFGLTLDQWFAPGFENSEEKLAYQRAYAEKMGLSAASSRDFAERAQAMFGRYEGIWKAIAAEMQKQKGYPVKSGFALGVGGPQCGNSQQAQSGGDSSASPGLPGALSALGGMFGKKKESAPAPSNTPATSAPAGLVPLMTVSTELVSVSRDPVSPQTFEVPAGFKQARE
jgi:hypothetical protein